MLAAWAGLLLLVGGCTFPVREEADRIVCDLAARTIDPGALAPADQLPSTVKHELPSEIEPSVYQQLGAQQIPPQTRPISKVPPVPKELPGSQVKMLDITESNRQEAIKRIYGPLPPIGPDPQPQLPPEGKPWTLADLQRVALASSPLIRQSAAALKAAEGAAVQAGLPPNPNVGYEGDTMGTGGSAGYNGFWVQQQIKTAGKLALAQSAALMDVLNAEQSLRRAQADLAYNVRNGYFAVLVARRNLAIMRALTQFMDELYNRQVELVLGGPAAPYEPGQLRGIAWTTRAFLIQARNRYLAAWKMLAANMGRPDLPLTELAGDIEMPVPVFDYEQAVQWILQNHTDVLTAENSVRQARYNLRLAQVMPIPDVDFRLMVQKDNTTLPHMVTPSVVMGIPVPVWNRNQGGIRQAQGNLLQQIEEPHRVRSVLVGQLADAFRRYRDGVALLQAYQNHIIPDQVRTYLQTYERHLQQPDAVGFADIVVAQQQMATGITTYVGALGDLWTAVADISHLLQTNDLYHGGDGRPLPTCELPAVPALPCCHPCSELSPQSPAGTDASWPLVLPGGLQQQTRAPQPEPDLASRER